jgi:hypothetical protein
VGSGQGQVVGLVALSRNRVDEERLLAPVVRMMLRILNRHDRVVEIERWVRQGLSLSLVH